MKCLLNLLLEFDQIHWFKAARILESDDHEKLGTTDSTVCIALEIEIEDYRFCLRSDIERISRRGRLFRPTRI